MSAENKAYIINASASIKDALKQLDLGITKVLLVVDADQRLQGTLTDGDIRRFILKGNSLEQNLEAVYHRSPITLKALHFTVDIARILIIENKIDLLPILDDENKIIHLVHREDIYHAALSESLQFIPIDIPVVIMAGGKGTRMEPFTKILPKPLIPIGETPIVEIIMDEFYKQGVKQFYLTLNFKGEMIEAYFNHNAKDYTIQSIWEQGFFGTAGSLLLVRDILPETFIVSNCDVIVKAHYSDVLKHHREQNAAITVLSSIQHHKIPYGVIDFREGGKITQIVEKPEFSFTINTGIYIIEKRVIDLIPVGTVYHMPDLINELLKRGDNVVTYPVNENEYVDIGQWDEYKKAMEKLQMLSVKF